MGAEWAAKGVKWEASRRPQRTPDVIIESTPSHDDVGRCQGSTKGGPRSPDGAQDATAMIASGPAMIDSGAGKHLTCKTRCTERELQDAAPTDVILLTAKGEERVNKEVEMYLDGLNLTVPALALDNCPNAVSLGRLVLEHGYTFLWGPKFPRPIILAGTGGGKTFRRQTDKRQGSAKQTHNTTGTNLICGRVVGARGGRVVGAVWGCLL